MGVCEQCGNEYDKTFDVMMNGRKHTFDSFECAIQMLAPQVRQLRGAHRRARDRGAGAVLLLRQLC